LHDKLQFARTAQTMGLDAPETHAMSDPAALALMAVSRSRHQADPLMLRHGVRLEKAGTIQEPDAISSSCLVQTLVRGRHVSSFTLAHEGQERISVLYEGTVFSGSVAVCFKRVDDCPAAHDWITAFVRKSEYSGAIAFDFIIDDSGRAWAIECNPRFTSGVHFISPEGLASALLKPESPGAFGAETLQPVSTGLFNAHRGLRLVFPATGVHRQVQGHVAGARRGLAARRPDAVHHDDTALVGDPETGHVRRREHGRSRHPRHCMDRTASSFFQSSHSGVSRNVSVRGS
jgi:hypothetical protein